MNAGKIKRLSPVILIYAFLLLGVLVVLYPFLYMTMNSFKTGPDILNAPNALPRSLTFGGYVSVFQTLNIPRLFFNTIFISVSVTVLSTLISAMVAYGIEKCDVPGKKFVKNVILSSMMIPGVLLLIPTYMMMYQWHWINTYRVMIIPAAVSAYNIFLFIQFCSQIDNAYLEAARIDGASEWRTFWSIALPMSRPALATVAILSFMGSWNDMMTPLLYLRGNSHMTLQLAIYNFSSQIPGKDAE